MSISTIRGGSSYYQIPQRALPGAKSIPVAVRITKRSIDVIFACLGLLLLGIAFPVIYLAIRLDSAGPVFYRQRRAGSLLPEGGFEELWMLKFRTMRCDAEAQTGAVLAQADDPRVTRVGRFLRKTRLDELPQFWNVLLGQMSLVGPRPERPELLQDLVLAIPFFEERMRDCKPGITGLAQISLDYTGHAPAGSPLSRLESTLTNPFDLPEAHGALADDLRTKLLFDLAYVASLERFETFIATELGIIARTPWVMLKGLGR